MLLQLAFGSDVCGRNPCSNGFTVRTESAPPGSDPNYREFFDNAVVGMFRTTLDGRFMAANKTLANMLGYESPDELVANVTDIGAQLFVDPGERAEAVSVAAETKQYLGKEIALRRADGTKIWVSEHGRVVMDQDGNPLYFEGTLEDVTDRKTRQSKPAGDLESNTRSGDPGKISLRAARMETTLHRIAKELALIGMDRTFEVARLDPSELEGFKSLTRREIEILRAIVTVARVRTIAKTLTLAPNTVRNHLTSIFIKLKIRSQTELIEKLRKRD